jgi:protein TonB
MKSTENENWLWVSAGLIALVLNFGCLVIALWVTLPDETPLSGAVVQRIEIDLSESGYGATETGVDRTDASETAPDKKADSASPPPQAAAAVPKTPAIDTSSGERDSQRPDGDNAATTDESAGQAVASSAAVSATLHESLSPARITTGPNADEDVQRIRLNWERRLLIHLGHHKRNPSGAFRSRAEVTLTFVLLRNGHVLSAKVSKSSGDASIDQAAMAMIRRSNPVPPPPTVVANQGLTFTIPILFLAKGSSR